jgi:hypothetical protein
MAFIFKRLALFLSISAAFAADKDAPAFRAGPAAGFANRQTVSKVTIGVEPYSSGEKVKAAFGKVEPYQHGILPVLVAIRNDGDKTIRLERMQVEYVGPNRDRIEATPANEVRYLKGPRRPNVLTGPTGAPKISKQKNPLDAWEIEGRAFAARMLPPGQEASGFFYFQTGLQRGAILYVTGLREADTGDELFYFEIPLQ